MVIAEADGGGELLKSDHFKENKFKRQWANFTKGAH